MNRLFGADARNDSHVFFVGPRGCGKSTLLNRYLNPTKISAGEPSEGVEYTYARKQSTTDHERKELAHIFEISGPDSLAEQLVSGQGMKDIPTGSFFLAARQVLTAVVVIVVDLSKPGSAFATASSWLDRVNSRLQDAYSKMEKKGMKLPEQLRLRAKRTLFANHEDKDVVRLSGISLLIVGTKYDSFTLLEAERRKHVCRGLRYLAHSHGAHLLFQGNLHRPQDRRRSGDADPDLVGTYRSILNHLIFCGNARRMQTRMAPQFDHLEQLMIPAGSDQLQQIGLPSSAAVTPDQIDAGMKAWEDCLARMFGEDAGSARHDPGLRSVEEMERRLFEEFKEEHVDTVRKAQDEKLERICRDRQAEVEARRRQLLKRQAQLDKLKKEKDRLRMSPVGVAGA